MREKWQRSFDYILKLIKEQEWGEINKFLGCDMRGVLWEMKNYAERQTPDREDSDKRVVYALLILQGYAGTASYRYGNGKRTGKVDKPTRSD